MLKHITSGKNSVLLVNVSILNQCCCPYWIRIQDLCGSGSSNVNIGKFVDIFFDETNPPAGLSINRLKWFG